ncbi:hypothetical protein DW074_11815 [Ruminococcus sp. AF46-10NS]|jgi:hypothetical protein|nr:hypothetical protein [Ruminococcus sp. AF46-10NS]RHK22915.1 hypothetical protein DW074_11815 [Ruminococcus sp. AF46-10NS]
MKKNTKITFSKSFSILAAAALSMTLISGQALTTYAGSSSGIESGAVIPDNITIDSPTALSNVALPSNSYGTLSWVDGSYVPEKRVQSCAVVFKPSTGADLSGLPGWDSSSGTLTGYVTVVISSLDSSSDENESADSSSDKAYDESDSYKDENDSENKDDTSESSAETSDEKSEDSSSEETAENGNVSEGDSYESSSETENGKDDNKDSTDVTETPDAQDSSSDKTNTDKNEETADNDNADEKKDNTEDNTTDDSADKDSTDKDTADNADPDITETPEATVTPSENENKADQDKDTDVTKTPEVTVTPAEDDSKTDSSSDTDKEDAEKDNKKDSKDETPDVTETPEEDKDNIFDRKDEEEDKRPQNAGTDLTETEKEQTAARNHTCDGITVSGIDLPWYVQFRVSGGEDYEFTNEEDATIFKSYEFELWDTQKNTEYKIPDGEYISVTVPVKAGYTYSIEHLLDNGAMETIIPSVDGGTMTFSTHSFSPFGIAGSKSLVGPDAGTDSSSNTTKTTPAATSSTDTTSSSDTPDITGSDGTENTDSAANLDTSADLSSGTADLEGTSSQNSTSSDESEDEASQATSKKQVNTGDNTQILPFVILFVAAAVVAGVAVFFKKRKK